MFAHWIKNRIEQYGFVEGVDYITHLPKRASGENQAVTEFTPGVLRKDYYLTLNIAKRTCHEKNIFSLIKIYSKIGTTHVQSFLQESYT